VPSARHRELDPASRRHSGDATGEGICGAENAQERTARSALFFDGMFLLRPELIDGWDLRIFVSATFEQTLDRGRIRDRARLGSTGEVERRFRNRYIPAQKLYFATARQTDHTDIIVHNDEPRRTAWEVRPL
jgi:uridine kinase